MRRGTQRRSEQNQLLDDEIGKIPGSYHYFNVSEVLPLRLTDFALQPEF
jgi:hypothetical protein